MKQNIANQKLAKIIEKCKINREAVIKFLNSRNVNTVPSHLIGTLKFCEKYSFKQNKKKVTYPAVLLPLEDNACNIVAYQRFLLDINTYKIARVKNGRKYFVSSEESKNESCFRIKNGTSNVVIVTTIWEVALLSYSINPSNSVWYLPSICNLDHISYLKYHKRLLLLIGDEETELAEAYKSAIIKRDFFNEISVKTIPTLDDDDYDAFFDEAYMDTYDHFGLSTFIHEMSDKGSKSNLFTAYNAVDLLSTYSVPLPQLVTGLIDKETTNYIIASPKSYKSFFMMYLCLSLATGEKFFKFSVPQPKQVLVFQFEIHADQYKSRLGKMCKNLGLSHEQIADRLHIVNARDFSIGKNVSELGFQGSYDLLFKSIGNIIEEKGIDVIALDPIYSIIAGSENNAEHMKYLLDLFDALVSTYMVTLIAVHHDKVQTKKNELIGRGGGSCLLPRHMDSAMYLTRTSVSNVMEFQNIARDRDSVKPFNIKFVDGSLSMC